MRVVEEHIHLPDRSLRFLNLSLGAFRARLHRHALVELTWVEHGTGVRYVGDTAEAFGPDDMVLLGSHIAHTWTSTPHQSPGLLRAKVIQFDASHLERDDTPELRVVRDLLARAGGGLRIAGAARRAVASVLSHMPGGSPLEHYLAMLKILAALCAAPNDLEPIARAATAATRAADSATKRRLDRLLEWTRAHAHEPVDAAQAAAVAHISAAAFGRFFRREIGKTYAQYLNDVRCARACALLGSTELAVAEIALACGFCASAHFNRRFKERMGMTPRDYRRHSSSSQT